MFSNWVLVGEHPQGIYLFPNHEVQQERVILWMMKTVNILDNLGGGLYMEICRFTRYEIPSTIKNPMRKSCDVKNRSLISATFPPLRVALIIGPRRVFYHVVVP